MDCSDIPHSESFQDYYLLPITTIQDDTMDTQADGMDYDSDSRTHLEEPKIPNPSSGLELETSESELEVSDGK
jgi:hypothetical protein